ncbi:CPCC family cysteine-rich protein [Metaclostridioides mangenotii]|uniref:CPCC family cysteine-rich protein n=1 Tax=Metaclostridioides mangenotii TaxID=1540 RepID=UPI0028F15521|nr:CPCC family cysteine-rich protein [Clostridioides mangenotii]
MKNDITIKCPVCGNEVDMYDICDNCKWQNNGPNEKESDLKGPNKMTLSEARVVYRNSKKTQ